MGRVIAVICIIVLVVAGIWWWRNYHNGTIYDGSVLRRDAAMENGTTTMENGQNLGEAHPTPSRSDAPGTINGDPIDANGNRIDANRYDLSTQTVPITQDPYGRPDRNAQQSAPSAPRIRSQGDRIPYPAPTLDTQAPDAPNGFRIGGNGSYQWYRQGNLTYRVDVQTGRSCIIYATIEEWRKPYVFRNGCRAW